MISQQSPYLFNRTLYRQRITRLTKEYYKDSVLHKEVAESLNFRLSSIRRKFTNVLIIGDIDIAELNLGQQANVFWLSGIKEQHKFVADSEFLPFAKHSFDLVISVFDLQVANDVPGQLTQILFSLQPDGVFQGVFLGGDTLEQLCHVTMHVEEQLRGGISPRVMPMIRLADAAALLLRAGFALPVADHEKIRLAFGSPISLLKMIKSCGLGNCLWQQARGLMTPEFLRELCDFYVEQYSDEKGVLATFDIIYLSGWAPALSQPKALKPGTGQYPLIDFLS